MLKRFEGSDGRSRVIEALCIQIVVGGDAPLASLIADSSIIVAFEAGEVVINEAASDNDIYFILAGEVSIQVGRREVAIRAAGQHFGEMALIDPTQPRSASVIARNEVVVAHVPEPEFTKLAESNPRLWRNIARAMAERLRQRNRFVAPMNTKPVLFIGCSSESLSVGREIQSALSHDPIVVNLWTDGVFGASSFPIKDLEHEVAKTDFAALVLAPEDTVISRSQTNYAPRDNIIFELGLFMGALGLARTM